MNKLITDFTGKHPFTLDDLAFIQNASKDTIAEIIKGLARDGNPLMIIYGCKFTIVSGTNANYSAGAVYMNGEIFSVDASLIPIDLSAVVVIEPVKTFAAPSPVIFQDLATHNVHAVRKARFIEQVNAAYPLEYFLMSNFKQLYIDDVWHTPTYQPDFVATGVPFQQFRYRLNRDGDLEIDGAFGVASSTNGVLSAFRLDDGWRPAKTQYIVVNHYINSSGIEYGYMEIDTDGWVKIVNNAAGGGNGYYINRQTVCMT
jgi:hypothetical protein